ncbi:MAG TPA: hypothetical protein VF188_16290 [Longimicrobiales bacterium]
MRSTNDLLIKQLLDAGRKALDVRLSPPHATALQAAEERPAPQTEGPQLGMTPGVSSAPGEPYHCNICGGAVDLSWVTKPTVSLSPGGRRR